MPSSSGRSGTSGAPSPHRMSTRMNTWSAHGAARAAQAQSTNTHPVLGEQQIVASDVPVHESVATGHGVSATPRQVHEFGGRTVAHRFGQVDAAGNDSLPPGQKPHAA